MLKKLLAFSLLLVSLSLILSIHKVQAKTRRINPVCISSHINALPQADADTQLALMQADGIYWTRFDFVWNAFQQTQGQSYDFSQYDYLVNDAAAHNIQVIALIAQYGLPPYERQDSTNYMSPPQSNSDFAQFVQTLATHYKGKIKLYEIGNEPNIPVFWPPTPDVTSYSALLKASYPAVKTGDPNAKVISAGLGYMPQNDPNFQETYLQGMYANGAKGSFDYFGYHPYTDPRTYGPDATGWSSTFGELGNLKQIETNNGDNKQIMATEVGWPSTIASGGVNEATQASYINRVYQKIEYENFKYVPIACIYDFVDDGTDTTNPEDNFGIIRNDYSLKPSYATMSAVRNDYNNHFIPINP